MIAPECCDDCAALATATCNGCQHGSGGPNAPVLFRPYRGDDER